MRDEGRFDQVVEGHVQETRRTVLPGLREIVRELADRALVPADVAPFLDALPEVLRAFLSGAHYAERWSAPCYSHSHRAKEYAYVACRVARDELVRSWSEPEREMAAQGALVIVAWNFFRGFCLDMFMRGAEHALGVAK